VPFSGHEDVRRRDVVVHDPECVGGLERPRRISGDPQRLLQRKRADFDQPAQRLPFEILHDQARPAVVLLEAVQRADARVIERGQRPGLAAEPLDRRRVAGQCLWQELQGDGPAETRSSAL